MPTAACNGIRLAYETIGDPGATPVLMVNGLGGQMIDWDPRLLRRIEDAGYRLIVFDNRDVGETEKLTTGKVRMADILAAIAEHRPFETPYDLADLAEDAVGLLDHLEIDRTHVIGFSMGGMIGQMMAIAHADRVLSLTSVMSTTGDRRVGKATPEAWQALTAPPPPTVDEAIEASVEGRRVIGSPGHFDENVARAAATASLRRCFYPEGVGRQLAALLKTGDRTALLAKVEVPTLVVHGTADPLIDISGGRATARAVPGATLVEIEGMGHDLPTAFWDCFLEALFAHFEAGRP